MLSSGENLALNKHARQSTQQGDPYAPGKAVNGLSYDFSHTYLTSNQWWSVDLGRVFSVDTIDVYNRADEGQSKVDIFTALLSCPDGMPDCCKCRHTCQVSSIPPPQLLQMPECWVKMAIVSFIMFSCA